MSDYSFHSVNLESCFLWILGKLYKMKLQNKTNLIFAQKIPVLFPTVSKKNYWARHDIRTNYAKKISMGL